MGVYFMDALGVAVGRKTFALDEVLSCYAENHMSFALIFREIYAEQIVKIE